MSGGTFRLRLVAWQFTVLTSAILPPLLQRWLPLAVIALVALWLRTRELPARPMHADEANQAVKTGELLEHGRYIFDPGDHHGPTLYYAALPIAWVRGEHSLAALSETTVRLVPAIAGAIAVVLLGILALPRSAGTAQDTFAQRWPAFAAAAFMAVSPSAVYYSRYFIQETLLVTCTLGAFFSASRWWSSGGTAWAIACGACVGAMQATKNSAALFVVAAIVAALVVRPGPPAAAHRWRDTLLAAATALFVVVLFFSSFGTHPAGLRDLMVSLAQGWDRLGRGSDHEKPWWYYLRLFTWRRDGGLLWEQLLFFALACGGLGVVLFCRSLLAGDRPVESPAPRPARGPEPVERASRLPQKESSRHSQMYLLRWAAIYIVIVGGVLSLIPYKTPWHTVHFVPGFALLAAGALVAISRLNTGPTVAGAMAFLCTASLAHQSWQAAFVRPADPRNPYAYVHSSPDVLKFRPLAETALGKFAGQPIRIISEEYWPLPWYFRGLPDIGYWSEPPAECDGALVIASTAQAETVRSRLRGSYRETFLGLRPGFICVVFTRER